MNDLILLGWPAWLSIQAPAHNVRLFNYLQNGTLNVDGKVDGK